MGSYGALWSARLRMLRPGNALMSAAAVLIGILLARDGALPFAVWVGAPLAAFLVTGFGNVQNDLADRATDRNAHPNRPLAAGAVTHQQAKSFAALLLVVGLVEAYIAGSWPLAAFAATNALLLWLYERGLKALGLPGNLLVGLLVGSAFIFGAAATGTDPSTWGMVLLLAAMAALSTAGREVVKDVEDHAADAATRRTLPHRIGTGRSLLVAFALVNAAVILSFLAYAARPAWWPWWLLILALADLVLLVGASLAWLDAGRGQRVLKLGMMVALAAFAAGVVLAGR